MKQENKPTLSELRDRFGTRPTSAEVISDVASKAEDILHGKVDASGWSIDSPIPKDEGFGPDGFDSEGYDRAGYDLAGFDRQGRRWVPFQSEMRTGSQVSETESEKLFIDPYFLLRKYWWNRDLAERFGIPCVFDANAGKTWGIPDQTCFEKKNGRRKPWNEKSWNPHMVYNRNG